MNSVKSNKKNNDALTFFVAEELICRLLLKLLFGNSFFQKSFLWQFFCGAKPFMQLVSCCSIFEATSEWKFYFSQSNALLWWSRHREMFKTRKISRLSQRSSLERNKVKFNASHSFRGLSVRVRSEGESKEEWIITNPQHRDSANKNILV